MCSRHSGLGADDRLSRKILAHIEWLSGGSGRTGLRKRI